MPVVADGVDRAFSSDCDLCVCMSVHARSNKVGRNIGQLMAGLSEASSCTNLEVKKSRSRLGIGLG